MNEQIPNNSDSQPVESVSTNDSFAATSVAPAQTEPVIEGMPQPEVAPEVAPVATASAPEAPAKKKGNIVVIILIILIILVVGGYFAYIKLFVTPQRVYETTISTLFQEIQNPKQNGLSTMEIDTSKPFEITGDASINSDIKELEMLNNFKIDYNFGMNAAENLLKLGLGLENTKDSTANLNADIYLLNSNIYLESKDLYSQPLLLMENTGLNLNSLSTGVTKSDMDHLLVALQNGLIASVKEGNLSSKSAKITIDGKQTSVTNNVLIIDSKNAGNIIKAFATSFKSDSLAIKTLASLSGSDEKTVTDYFNKLATSTDGSFDDVKCTINVYVGGLLKNKLQGIDVNIGEGENLVKIESRLGKNNTTSTLTSAGIVATIVADDNKISVDAKQDSQELFNLTINIEKDKVTFELNAGKVTATGTITSSKVNDNEIKYAVDFTVKGDTSLNLGIKMNADVKNNASIKAEKIENAKKINELTETDTGMILQNVQSKLEKYGVSGAAAGDLLTGGSLIGESGYNNFQMTMIDFKEAAQLAIENGDVTGDSVCLSKDFLSQKGYLDSEYASYTGSVLVNSSTKDYKLWISDGTNGVNGVDFYQWNEQTTSLPSASNNCNSTGTLH